MASEQQVKQYLAYWFQLGKKVILHNDQEALLPQRVIEGDRYSLEFERCWQRILRGDSGDCYLEGTEQTIQQLLTPSWDIEPCARCDMPVPMIDLGIQSPNCTCNDLPTWPNKELPAPRSPVDTQKRLSEIRERLLSKNNL
ncbi:MAG: hypothetical protein AB4426_31645 [Xenococcaceae cyanobacterium]